MTNRTSLLVALLVLGAIWADMRFDWGGSLFLMRKIDGLIGWLAFWR
ncbi:hypothetical protein SAMN04488020_101283 [Palleronia marisminoris]|uniref:Uncharacterized protein n=1 Tax=Palleronia marisminoris TaxID=315423 RepID=A0A1Y5RDJ8_9RHOB|nr:hypothetical protein [Palleronia marisminoris]SFG13883.1 hypothetical protein SAMN04488020_101283 [Palleronia marisminoris]SLN14752.1 hypothetical protein PAM7066_00284 [Palleronia marisminoris]